VLARAFRYLPAEEGPMLRDTTPSQEPEDRRVWNALLQELREIAWLASVVGILSVAGVGLAILLAAA
jgi:hypothetical protein